MEELTILVVSTSERFRPMPLMAFLETILAMAIHLLPFLFHLLSLVPSPQLSLPFS